MNTCKWCNATVSDHRTVWVRKNLVLGYSFCSTRCAAQWKEAKERDDSSSNETSKNDMPSIEDLRYQQEERRLLREQQDMENKETAIKTMALVKKLAPYWKIIVPIYLLAFIATLFLLDPIYAVLTVIAFVAPIGGVIWAYFTAPKN